MPEAAPRRIGAVAVVVPAHDEELLLGRCLAAIDEACRTLAAHRPDVRVVVVVVLDACRDSSAEIAGRSGVQVVEIDARCVGAARAAGVRRAVELLGTVPAPRVWLACTDADSVVTTDWLTHQVAAAESGADLVLGRVRPDPEELEPTLLRRWHTEHPPHGTGMHVHGANLGVRLAAYRAAGGFDDVPEHEDVLLVQRLCARGLLPAPGREVLTSARLLGRVEGGFSGYLRGLRVADDPVA